MPSLRSAMRAFLEDWEQDVAPAWRDLLTGVRPAFEDIDSDLEVADDPIFPGRKGREPEGAPDGSHVFRALDGIDPADVRAVVLGQDPYPRISRATGRAFEQGDLPSWTEGRVAASLRRILQLIVHLRTGNEGYRQSDGWRRLSTDLRRGEVELEDPRAMFDGWQGRGVLFLNTGLTLTRYEPGGHPHQLTGHIPLWAPVVGAICRRLAERPDIPVVFLSWGSKARQFLASTGILESRNRPVRVSEDLESTDVVDRDHPATARFLRTPNLFTETNEKLVGLGSDPIEW